MKESGDRELRLYYFITKFIEASPDGKQTLKEGVTTILSFDLDRAVAEASRSLPIGTQIILAGHKLISEIIEMIKTEEKKEVEIKLPEEVIAKKLGKEEFKNNLLLAADTMVADEKDQKALKRIISKIV